jgi:probable phosphoglycerate mutase
VSARDPVRITFVRHGESVSNVAKRWQGHGDSPLSALGREQARVLGRRLAKRRFDRVVASDLSRASDTARATGFAFEQDTRWREFDVGRWEGLTHEEVEERYPEEIARLKQGEDIPLGGGESYAVFAARVDAAVDALRRSLEPGQRALVVCHGGVIGAVVSGLLGLRGSRRFPLSRVGNTAISELAWTEDGAQLHVYNDGRHLSALGAWPAVEARGQGLEASAGCVALVNGGRPAECYGAFEAHYDAHEALQALSAQPPEPSLAPGAEPAAHGGRAPEGRLRQLVRLLSERHADRRVSVAAPAAWIHAWAACVLWPRPQPALPLAPPAPGALCHVTERVAGLVLQDYGVSRD